MIVRFDSKLVETVVFQEVRCLEEALMPELPHAYHSLLDPLYGIQDARKREDAFVHAHRYFFDRMGWRVRMESVLGEFPVIGEKVAEVLVREEYSVKGEGAELYIEKTNEGEKKVVALQVRASRFRDREALESFLRHELMHIQDMLNPKFGYLPDLGGGVRTSAEENLIRERYRILWSVSVDGRLAQAGKKPHSGKEECFTFLARYFRFLGDSKLGELFDSLWNDENPRHARLLEVAKNPRSGESLPGRPCPLCDFPTFDWSEEDGICGQCAEICRVKAAGSSQP